MIHLAKLRTLVTVFIQKMVSAVGNVHLSSDDNDYILSHTKNYKSSNQLN